MNTLYFPLVIESENRSIKLSESAKLTRIDDRRVSALLGIRQVVLTPRGHIREISYHDGAAWYIWATYLREHNFTHNLLVNQTNFVLSVATRRDALHISCAMKLLAGTRSGPYIGFSDVKSLQFSIAYLGSSPYWGGPFLALGRKEISLLRRLVEAIDVGQSGGRFETIIEKYRYAESANVPSQSHRYIEFAIVLEMLFLPTADRELSYRFQLRISKWFKRHYHTDISSVAAKAKRIYKLRSDIAHSGAAKISADDLDDIRSLTRMALRKFVLDASSFTDKYLDELCLLE